MKSAPILCALSLAALPSCTTTHGQRTFRSLDANGDRKVSPQEFTSHVGTESFRTLDTNRDGRIVPAEWTEKETHTASDALFGKLDRNHDGSIESTEFAAPPESDREAEIHAVFHTLDRNADGALEWNEIAR
jgi:Ca2+-binding EF-hand superfamily protein